MFALKQLQSILQLLHVHIAFFCHEQYLYHALLKLRFLRELAAACERQTPLQLF